MKSLKNQYLGEANKIFGNDKYGVMQFLIDYPEMSIVPTRESGLILEGMFSFSAKPDDGVSISDSYHLKIFVSNNFPHSVPVVREIDEKIPREADHHVNRNNTICLGTPIRLLLILLDNPTMVGFAEKILVPFLYSISHQRMFGGKLPADELAHGEEGIIYDYMKLFKLSTSKQISLALEILGSKKRIANKMPCPCGCGKHYGSCKYRKVLEQYRKLANRCWFRKHAKDLGGFTNIQ